MTFVMRPPQGSAAFQARASACVSRVISSLWITCAPLANRFAAASLSERSSAALQARATASGEADLWPPHAVSASTPTRIARIRTRIV